MKIEFFNKFSKILKYETSRKSVQWEPSFPTRTARQADITKLIVAFRNFVNETKNHEFTRSSACVGYIASCEVDLNKLESVSGFFCV